MRNVVGAFRDHLIAEGVVRRPDVAGPGGRPWLPPAWKIPDEGAIGPGDAAAADRPAVTHDDGLVLSIFMAPGFAPAAGEEDIRRVGVDVHLRGNAVPAILNAETAMRSALLGDPPGIGGRVDWMMADLYVIQLREHKPLQILTTGSGTFTFLVGYLLEIRP